MTGRGNNTYLLAAENGSAALVDAGTGEPQHLAELDGALGSAHAQLAHAGTQRRRRAGLLAGRRGGRTSNHRGTSRIGARVRREDRLREGPPTRDSWTGRYAEADCLLPGSQPRPALWSCA